MRLTVKILTELQQGPMTTREIAAIVRRRFHTVQATVNNLRTQGCVQPTGTLPKRSRRSPYIWAFVKMPRPQGRPWPRANHRPAPKREGAGA